VQSPATVCCVARMNSCYLTRGGGNNTGDIYKSFFLHPQFGF
jgi:hypothetical protein